MQKKLLLQINKKMKKYILFTIILYTTISNAQNINFGIKSGFNVSNVFEDLTEKENEIKSKFGFQIGGFAEFKINKNLSFHPEILFSNQVRMSHFQETKVIILQGEFKYSVIRIYNLNYINFPLMFDYKLSNKFNVEFGPQIGYLISGKTKLEYENESYPEKNQIIEVDITEKVKYNLDGLPYRLTTNAYRFDFGLNFGASYDLSNSIFIQGLYNFGLTSLEESKKYYFTEFSDNWNLKNSVFQLSLGYRFLKSK